MRTKIAVLAAAVCFSGGIAMADKIEFKNGDVLTGKLTEYDGKKLSIKTDNAGTVSVDLKDVKTFSTDNPIELKLNDGTVIKQKAVASEEGSVGIADGAIKAQSFSFGQIKQINPPPVKWTGSITAGAVLTRGNTFSDQYHAGFDLLRRADDDRITASGSYNFGREKDPDSGDKVTSMDNWTTQGKYDYFIHDTKWYLFANALVAHDRIQDLTLRFIPSVGAGYQWIESQAMNFNTEAGIAWIYEDYDNQSTKEEVAARLAYHFDKTLSKSVKFIHNFEYIPGLQAGSGYLVNTDAGIRADITESFFLEGKVQLTHNSQPAPGKAKDDIQYIFGVGWRF